MRKIYLREIVSILLICYVNSGYPAIYMHVDKNGTTVYSDAPESPASTIVKLSKPAHVESSVPSISLRTSEVSISVSKKSEVEDDREGYHNFRIITPRNNENIQNQVTVPVKFEIKPELKKGDKIQLVLDGKPIGDAVASTTITLPWVERGTHQLSAVIIDQHLKVVKNAGSITIFIHRSTLNTPTRQQSDNEKTKIKRITAAAH